jgi:hypothetical protein
MYNLCLVLCDLTSLFPRCSLVRDAESATATQELEFTTEDHEGLPKAVKFVSFQDTSSLTLFIQNNVGDLDETVIQTLVVNGQKVQGTNMNDLKPCG